MPRVTQAWKSDPDRSRYYRLRADKLEMTNALARQDYVEAKQNQERFGEFLRCDRNKDSGEQSEPGNQN
jgi:hypothetical protein